MHATKKINLYVHTQKNLPWQYQQLPLPNHLPLHLPPDHQKHHKETIQKGSHSKGKDLLMNHELPEKPVATATPEPKKHTPEAIHSAHPKCSWSLSSIGCLLPRLEPKDKCGIESCQLVLHHMCQTEWESYQYRLECPNGTQVYLSMIQVERRDASTIILIVNW